MLVIPKRWSRLFFLFLALCSCASDAPSEEDLADCRYQAPEPVFREALSGVSGYRFQRDGMSATESFVLNRQVRLRLRQSGCDYIRQEFLFEWKGGPRGSSDRFWVREAAAHFEQLAHLGAPYVSFKALGDALREHEVSIRREQAFELQPGLTATVIPLSKGSPKQLKVVLRQE